MCTVIHCYEINLIFLIKSFFLQAEKVKDSKSRQKLQYTENENKMKHKAFSSFLKGAIIEVNNKKKARARL